MSETLTDPRIVQCRELKKVWKKARRKGLWLWWLLTGLSFAVALVFYLMWADGQFLDGAVSAALSLALPVSLMTLAPWIALGCWGLHLAFLVLCLAKQKQLRRTAAWLEWRTLKTALDTEKEEQ